MSRFGPISKKSDEAKGGNSTATASAIKPFKPSDKLNPKTIDLFNTKEIQRSAFGTIYSNGGIPCRLVHGSVRNRLMWNMSPDEVPFDPVLVTLAEGLRETQHPFDFVARTGFKDLIESQDAYQKALNVLPKLIIPIKNALIAENDDIFEAGLNALMQVSDAVGPHLNPHLKMYLSILCRRISKSKYKNLVNDALNKFEKNGGKETIPIIKSKIPTYNCIS